MKKTKNSYTFLTLGFYFFGSIFILLLPIGMLILGKYIILQGDKLNNDILSKEIRRLPIKTCQCYIISESYCGFIISLEEALNFVFDNYSASILIIDNIIAVIKEESEKSVAQKYLLYKHG